MSAVISKPSSMLVDNRHIIQRLGRKHGRIRVVSGWATFGFILC